MNSRAVTRLRRLGVIAFSLATPGSAAEAGMLHDHDNGPLTGYFGIPDSSEGAGILGQGSSHWEALLLAASHSVQDERNSESITLDGETTRLELIYRRGVRRGLEVGIELPFIWHESGGLDPLVDEWHDVLGLSGGFRRDRTYGLLEFQYADGNGTQLDFHNNSSGFGDVRLFAGWQLRSDPSHAAALRVGLKIPTGDSETLLGSGSTDISVGIAGDMDGFFGFERLSAGYRAGAVFVGQPDFLADRYRNFVGHVSLGLGLDVGERIELRLQGAFRSPLYDADVEPLGDPSVTVTFGGNFQLSQALRLSAAVTEDVKVRSAPDVTFQLAVIYQPD